MGLAWLFVLGVAVQFLLAGLNVMGNESIDPHRGLGNLLTVVSILLLILAFTGRAGGRVQVLTAALAVLSVLQSVWAEIHDPAWIRSLHVLGALVIFAVAHAIARDATALSREEA